MVRADLPEDGPPTRRLVGTDRLAVANPVRARHGGRRVHRRPRHHAVRGDPAGPVAATTRSRAVRGARHSRLRLVRPRDGAHREACRGGRFDLYRSCREKSRRGAHGRRELGDRSEQSGSRRGAGGQPRTRSSRRIARVPHVGSSRDRDRRDPRQDDGDRDGRDGSGGGRPRSDGRGRRRTRRRRRQRARRKRRVVSGRKRRVRRFVSRLAC